MRLCLLTTTYNRPGTLARLYRSTDAECAGQGWHLTRCLVDDGSDVPYALHAGADHVLRLQRHGGRELYWCAITALWRLAKTVHADYYIQVPDDVVWYPGRLLDGLRHWQAITDERKLTLNLLVEGDRRHGPCWTGVPPARRLFGRFAVFQTQWVDMCFVAERRFFDILGWRVHPVDLRHWRGISSGVGHQISRRLHRDGWSLYQLPTTALSHGAAPSVMHPVHRQKEPMYA